jgi:hypothetical protein
MGNEFTSSPMDKPEKKKPCAVERLSGVCLDKRIRKGFSCFERKKNNYLKKRGPTPCCVPHAVESFPFFHDHFFPVD